jgi:hypothetical protein
MRSRNRAACIPAVLEDVTACDWWKYMRLAGVSNATLLSRMNLNQDSGVIHASINACGRAVVGCSRHTLMPHLP